MIPMYSARFSVLSWYIARQFFSIFAVCLFIATSLFLVIDFFERARVTLREEASFFTLLGYLSLKIPIIISLMCPVAVLLSALFIVGKLSQSSEITAMRACGSSLLSLVFPLLLLGLTISIVVLLLNETIVPWSSQRVQEIYNFQIRKKEEKGALDQQNYWYRSGSKFYNLGLYDSRKKQIHRLSVFEVDSNFRPQIRTDANEVSWENSTIGWTMSGVMESSFKDIDKVAITSFSEIPLVMSETPKDFYKLRKDPDTMSYFDLRKYIGKLEREGVSASKYKMDLAAKLAFPFVNFVVVLIAFPFGLVSARSSAMTLSIIVGVIVGFCYYIVHAFVLSLGNAELIAVVPAAWSANILMGCVGGYFLFDSE